MDDIRKYIDIVDQNSKTEDQLREEVLTELRQLDESVVRGIFKLLSVIIGSVFRLAQLGFFVIGGSSGFLAGGMRGLSTGAISRIISVLFDALRLGANAGKYLTGKLADIFGGPGGKLMDAEDDKPTDNDIQVKRELDNIEKAVNDFVQNNNDKLDNNVLTKDLAAKMAQIFGKKQK